MPVASSIATLTLNPAVDQVCWVEAIEGQEKIRAREAHFEPGGGGINVARALDALGDEPSIHWSEGGESGQLLERLLDASGLDHRALAIEGDTRINLLVFQDGAESRLLFDMPGPTLQDSEVDEWLDRADGIEADLAVLSGRRPPDGGEVYSRLVHRLNETSRVVLDTSGPGLARTLEEGVFLVKPNLGELSDLVGTELVQETEIEAAARILLDTGMAEVVVVSLGDEGALAVTADELVRVDAPRVPRRGDVGAGDSMVAGLVHQLAAGAELEEAVRYGVAAGADAVRRRGTDLCTPEGVEELLERDLRPRG